MDDFKDETQKRKRLTSEVFSRAAETYGRIGPAVFPFFGERLVEFAQVRPGSKILDVASGRGAVLFPSLEQVGPEGEVVGIDISTGMAWSLLADIQQRKVKNAAVLQMDAEDIQFQDASFDLVTCGFGLFFFPGLQRAMAEFLRVLKPSGKLVVTTWGPHDERWDWLDPLFDLYLPGEPPGENNASFQPKPDFHSAEGMQAIFSAAGFLDVQIKCEEADFVYTNEMEWWQSIWSHGTRHEMEQIEALHGQAGLERFKRQAFDQLAAQREVDGIHELCRVIYTSGIKKPR